MGYLDMISQIEVQVIKNLTYTPTDEQLVAISGDYAIVGAYAEDDGGAAYIYEA